MATKRTKVAASISKTLNGVEASSPALRKLGPAALPPHHADPRRELQRLCREHAAWTQKRVALVSMQADKKKTWKAAEWPSVPTPTGRKPYAEIKKGDVVLHGDQEVEVLSKSVKAIVVQTRSSLPLDVRQMLTHEAGTLGETEKERAADLGGVAEALKKHTTELEKQMSATLKTLPIYEAFVKRCWGLGDGVIPSYLVGFLDIVHGGRDGMPTRGGVDRVCADPALTSAAQLVRYCGYAVVENKIRVDGTTMTRRGLERPSAGRKLGYNADMRKRMWQWFDAMVKNINAKTTRCPDHTWKGAGKSKKERDLSRATSAAAATCPECLKLEAPLGWTNKYLDLAEETRKAFAADLRFDAAKNTFDGRPSARAAAYSKGRSKAIALLVEDFYLVSRALAGLPVSPSRYASRMGYAHGGEVKAKGPTPTTLQVVYDLIGDLAKYPRRQLAAAVVDEDDAEE